MLHNLHRSLHRLDLGEQFILFPIALCDEIVHAELICESGALVVDVLVGFTLHWGVYRNLSAGFY